jgi:hypothetical protein
MVCLYGELLQIPGLTTLLKLILAKASLLNAKAPRAQSCYQIT